jgi:tetratricopeptide (TPR) repeat protein
MPPDNDVQKEIEQLERRYAEHPQGLAFAHLADAYRRAGEYGKAEGLLLHGLKNHPSYISAYNVLGRVYADSERYSDAHEQFSKVLELDPQNMIAMKALGELAVRGGRLEDARSWFERILQVDPRNEEVQEELQKLVEGAVAAPSSPVATPQAAATPAESAAVEIEEPEAGEGPAEQEEAVWEIGGVSEGEEEGPVEVSAEPVEGLVGKGQQVELGGEADAADALPDVALEGLSELESLDVSSAAGPEEAPQTEGLEALEALDGPPAAEARASGAGPEIDLGAMDDWTPGFIDEELKGRAGDDLGVGSLRAEFGGGEAAESGQAPGGMLTETMAELYADQGLYEDALGVYHELAKARPGDERLKARIAELQQLADSMAEAGGEDDELAELLELTDVTPPEGLEFPEAPALPEEPAFPDAPASPDELMVSEAPMFAEPPEADEEPLFFEAPPLDEALPAEETRPPGGILDAPDIGIGEPTGLSLDAAAAAPERVPAAGEFDFQDEAPLAGMDHLDPFAASFDVMVRRGDAAPMPAGVGGLGDLARAEPAEAPAAPEVAAETPEPELEIVPTIEEPAADFDVAPAADVLPPGADVAPLQETPPPEPELYLTDAAAPAPEAPTPVAEPPAPVAPAAQQAGAPTIEEYLAALLAFDIEKSAAGPAAGAEAAAPPTETPTPSASDDAPGAAEPAEASGSEDLEQFQEWLRSLKE